MSRRRAGVGRISIPRLTTLFLLLPVAFGTPQQDQHAYPQSQVEDGQPPDRLSEAGHARGVGGKILVDNIKFKHLKETNVDSKDSRAIATLAPARDAVRAPKPAQESGKPAGVSSLLNARSLQDWEVEDFILLATVDGSIYARNRTDGAHRWNLDVDKPMISTTYHRSKRNPIENPKPEDQYLWIVEPSQDGDIYIYDLSRAHNGLHRSGLQRLQMTVKGLADIAPWGGDDSAVVYTAEKKTTLYDVDARTGQITKIFSPFGSPIGDNKSCWRNNALGMPPEDECGTEGTLVLGRTEYTIGIQHKDTQEPICTLQYSEWGPNNRDRDLHKQYSETMDNRYVYTSHDGRIFGFDHGAQESRNNKPRYIQKLSSPVVRVWDVARPFDSDVRDAQLVLLPQPIVPTGQDDEHNALRKRNIFVNQTKDGGWYAMSESSYPLVTGGAPTAQCYTQDWLGMTEADEILSTEEQHQALVGVHSLAEGVLQKDNTQKIGGGSGDGSASKTANTNTLAGQTPRQTSDSKGFTIDFGSSVIVSYSTAWLSAYSADIFVVLILIAIVFTPIFVFKRKESIISGVRAFSEKKRKAYTTDSKHGLVPSSPLVSEIPKDQKPDLLVEKPVEQAVDESAEVDQENDQPTPTISRRNTLVEKAAPIRSRSSTLDEEGGKGKSGQRVRIVEPSPSPTLDDEDQSPDTPTPETPKKKKTHRGTRGGTKHKKKKNGNGNKSDEAELLQKNEAIKETIEEAMQIGKESTTPQPDVVVLNGSHNMADVTGPVIQIGHLKVETEVILGYGSHGTMVYKGSFGGRDVAVKRMLLQFYDIASHEVGLLQESDDHPNVIRYYDKEAAGEFLYIALELCPASLQEVVEKPYTYPSLVGPTGLDMPDVLRQITSGLRYLHSLKIVHRDIKPQNILVSAPKRLPTKPDAFQPPRLLISDFGLCKKLEGDQSSFRATTAHAAGTSGWRAPELLVDDDAVTNPNATSTSSFPSSHSFSEPLILDTQTNRRATRAIDIFSLGCVFYYVLTSGSHPFDQGGKFMREANIVKDDYNLDELARLGDYRWEAHDLISRMISHNPKSRPDAATILAHPFFWPPSSRLEFLCHVSDQFEFECRDPPSPALQALESYAPKILGEDFLKHLPTQFKDTLGKQRKYSGNKLLDLLRALRNKKNHYEDMPEGVKEKVGPLPEGYLGFWTRRFPGLLMGCHSIIKEVGWEGRDRFRGFYTA